MKVTRREFIKGAVAAGAVTCASKWVNVKKVLSSSQKSQIFRVYACPAHDGQLRHVGLDTLLDLLAENGLKFYRTNQDHQWGGPAGIIDANDVVLIKVNCQWKCRGTTNTDVLRGLIYRILQHPDGFKGEVVIFENGQGRGGFDGITQGGSAYASWPEIDNEIYVNAEEQNLLTVDYLVYTVFKNDPVSSFLLDPIRSIFIPGSDNITNGYRSMLYLFDGTPHRTAGGPLDRLRIHRQFEAYQPSCFKNPFRYRYHRGFKTYLWNPLHG
jgi:hypothetical protein